MLECGVPAKKPIEYAAKIVGGVVSNPHSWPWQVMISDGNTPHDKLTM